MTQVTAIYRHPVKALGAEALEAVDLRPGETLPGDRVWALAHEKTDYDWASPGWARCSVFLRGAYLPTLMAVTAEGAPGGAITFRHPARPDLTVDPGTAEGEAAFVAWADPLVEAGRPRPARLTPAIGRGMTDHPDPLISVLSDASRRALGEHAGLALDRRRFRGNLWVDGLPPWGEFDLVGREISVGGARLRVVERIERCSATHADPQTGRRDVDLLALLERIGGHRDFGVFAEVLEGGPVRVGDGVAA
ncbi:MAG: MOSC domain-containing protein [Pseudomonadota bacterium]